MKRYLPFLLLLSVALSACGISLASDVTPPPGYQPAPTPLPAAPPAPPDPARAAAIFAEKCAPCHGEQGLGDGPDAAILAESGVTVPALAQPDVARQASPAAWYAIVTNGNIERRMPPFTSLTQQERWDVVAYALSLSVSAGELADGQELFAAQCARCHGDAGLGDGFEAASLPAQPASFADQAFMAQRSAADFFDVIAAGKDPMPSFANLLTEGERWALAAYLRSLSFAPAQENAGLAGTPAPEITASPQETPGLESTPGVSETLTAPISVTFPASITVSGQVIHASGGAVPPALDIILYLFDHTENDIQLSETFTAATGADGQFFFDNVPVAEGRVVAAAVETGGTTFGSDIVVMDTPSLSLTLPITIYNTISDPALLTVNRLHIVFDFSLDGLAQVQEIYAISNPNDAVAIASEPGGVVIPFAMPAQASQPTFFDGEVGVRYLLTEDGFGDTELIYPGASTQVQYFYSLPYTGQLDFSHPLPVGVQAATILLPEGAASLAGAEFIDEGAFSVEGAAYHIYSFNGQIQPGGSLSFSVKGSSAGAPFLALPEDRAGLVIGLAVFGGALVFAGVWMYWRSRRAPAAELAGEAPTTESPAAQDAEGLIDAINALDDLYREGELPEEAYRARRNELKAQLRAALNE